MLRGAIFAITFFEENNLPCLKVQDYDYITG